MRPIYLSILFLAILSSCGNRAGLLADKYPYTLKETQLIAFPLDTTQGFYNNCIRYDGAANTFMLLNEFNNMLYTYDYSKQELISKKVFEKHGPNGVGSADRAGFLVDHDTTYFLNFKTGRLSILIRDSVVKTFDLYPKVFESEGFAEATTLHPMYKRGNKITLVSQSIDPREDNTKLNNFITIDLTTSAITRSVKRPQFYNTGYWGMFNPYKVYHAFNRKKLNYIFSFCADPKLHIYDTTQTEIKTIDIQTDYFANTDIKPISGITAKDGMNFLNNQKEKAQMHDFITPSYGPFFYDEYNDVYYRFVNHPLSKREYNDPNMFEKYPMEFSIIILDNSFNKIGEYLLPRKGYFTGMMLITKDGLIISKLDTYKKNENQLPFGVFKLVKNEKK